MKLYNSLTKRKETFTPITPGTINIYVCGMTVYDYGHIGHARSMMITFDMMTRYWRACGFKVNYVRNITDIDDKIIHRARENEEEYFALTERFIKAMHEDAKALSVLPPDIEPRATGHIDEIIEITKILIDKEFAYVADNGDVYYRVRKFNDYGKLSHKTIDDLQVGARINPNEKKEDPLDFVLWKAAKPDEPSWDSPWGKGRPGWHIECSAMSCKALGKTFDIHGGGADLKFPHHENEIAQSEAANDCTFAKFWVHAGLVQINDEKMSKSLGNFFTIRDILKNYRGEVLRFFMLSSHYRSPISYSEDNLKLAQASLETLYTALRGVEVGSVPARHEYLQKFHAAMDDDFNTPEAFGVMFEIAHALNKAKLEQPEEAQVLAAVLKHLGEVLGILQSSPDEFLKGSVSAEQEAEIEALIAQRETARAEKNWAKADEIRNKLTELNVSLEDTSEGTLWRKS